MDLSIVVVNYNTKDQLEACLRSVLKSKTSHSFEVFVVDNLSTDGSVEMVERLRQESSEAAQKIHLIKNTRNAGYSAANNLAIKKSPADFVLLLNPDTVIASDTLEIMLGFMKARRQVGIAGCKVVKPNGTLDLACRRSFPNPVNAFFRFTHLSFLFPKSRVLADYNLSYRSEDEVAEVDSVTGAFLMISRQAMSKVGLLDEDFFMYGEDLDWCWRVKTAGFKVIYYPKTTIVHYKGSASKKSSSRSLYEFHRAMQTFFDKHYKTHYNVFIRLLVFAGIWLRFAFLFLINAFRTEKIVST